MSIDLSQFHQVFFEESFEGLDAMEAALMELDPAAIDSETINTIFRAAHSIKGGSATFGFSSVAEFTHILETLLDDIRDGRRGISQDDVDLFLQSVDCLRDLLQSLQQKEEPDTSHSLELSRAFEAILSVAPISVTATEPTAAAEPVAAASVEAAESIDGPWIIHFIPGAEILKTGNEPLRMLRELADLGRISVEPILDAVPAFAQLNPENCYLGWDITLRDRVPKEQVEEVFEWVVDESKLDIILACHALNTNQGWQIDFKPSIDVLRTGNEPLRMFRELGDLGQLSVSCDTSALPSWSAMEPEASYLAWQLKLEGEVAREAVDEAFEWVVDESDLTIVPLASAAPADKPAVVEAPEVELASVESAAPEDSNSDNVVPLKQNDGTTPQAAPPVAAKATPKKSVSTESSSIRVGIDKVDSLINMVGELVITQSMLGQLGEDFVLQDLQKLQEGLGQLEQNTRELQESVMRIRMLPISFAFSRFPRMVRDLSRRLDKQMNLTLIGETTELDKTVMEKIGDPLVHLVRNSVDHGIELPAVREAAGKDPMGQITLNAYHQGGNVVIEITDDGKGLDRERIRAKAVEKELMSEKEAAGLSDSQVHDLIFHPGFSTANEVSDVSGRGVGMDVVRRNIADLNGTVELASEQGKGSTVTIRLPLTLAILDGQLVKIGSQTYIFPLVSIIESMQIGRDKVSEVAGGCDVFQLRNEFVPIVRLYDVFNIEPNSTDIGKSLLVVVESEGEKIGIVVDDLEAQQQVVIKSLEQNYQRIEGISGATILGDGTVALILDVPGLVNIAGVKHTQSHNIVSLAAGQRQAERAISG